MNLNQVYPLLSYKFTSEHDLIKAIQELSINFTQNRQDIEKYLKDPRLSSAYTAFYLTTNFPKLEAVFKWMDSSWLEDLKSCDFYDVGAGPGTFTLAFREWVGKKVNVFQIENSQIMKEQARNLWEGFYPDEVICQDLIEVNQHTKKFALFGHSANEMGDSVVLSYIEKIAPDHILFIEPGTRDFFSTMIKIREKLILKGYDILFPCPNISGCPLEGQGQDWCHQFIDVRHNSDVERLSQMARKDRRFLPISVFAFSLRTYHKKTAARVIRVFPETKFSFDWEVCESNQIYRYQVMKRGLSKKNLDLFSRALAGDHVMVEIEKSLESMMRVRVKRINNFDVDP